MLIFIAESKTLELIWSQTFVEVKIVLSRPFPKLLKKNFPKYFQKSRFKFKSANHRGFSSEAVAFCLRFLRKSPPEPISELQVRMVLTCFRIVTAGKANFLSVFNLGLRSHILLQFRAWIHPGKTQANHLYSNRILFWKKALNSASFSWYSRNHKIWPFLKIQMLKKRSLIIFSSPMTPTFFTSKNCWLSRAHRGATPRHDKFLELSEAPAREIITISPLASQEPQTVTITSNSNDPTNHYGYRRRNPIFLFSLNNLNLPPNTSNNLATIAVVPLREEQHKDGECFQLPVISEISSTSMPSTTISTVDIF